MEPDDDNVTGQSLQALTSLVSAAIVACTMFCVAVAVLVDPLVWALVALSLVHYVLWRIAAPS